MAENRLELFQALMNAGKEINLLNVYKGVPISFPAQIVNIEQGYVFVQTDTHQAVCMYLEKSTHIQSPDLPEVLRADVINLDAKRQIAVLGNFQPAQNDIGSRNLVRIQPQEPLEGEIHLPATDNVESGELADLSQSGLAVFIKRSLFNFWRLGKGDDLVITMNLPGTYTIGEYYTETFSSDNAPVDRFSKDNIRFSPVPSRENRKTETRNPMNMARKVKNPRFTIKAVIVNIISEPDSDRYRVGMRILSTDLPKTIITQFIAQRQSEIIREIKELYHLLSKKET